MRDPKWHKDPYDNSTDKIGGDIQEDPSTGIYYICLNLKWSWYPLTGIPKGEMTDKAALYIIGEFLNQRAQINSGRRKEYNLDAMTQIGLCWTSASGYYETSLEEFSNKMDKLLQEIQ